MPGRRLRIVHHTAYQYAEPVDVSFNEVRMTPLDSEGQRLLGHELSVYPGATIQTYTDYWGAFVEAFDVHTQHRVLEITATSTVDTPPTPKEPEAGTWSDVHASSVRDRFAEFLSFSNYVDHADSDDERRALVERLRALPRPRDAALASMEAIRAQMTYTPGVTSVYTTAAEAWSDGHGVCQDFSHVLLSLLRTLGVPARYVSGYLHTEEEAPGDTVVGESHAWVEYWDGDWHALDPTNDRAVGSAHVIVARGRDYSDVAPVSGIYAGGQSAGFLVSVSMTQLVD
jgi:transglutaminase-like putative cysteine protease